MLYLLVKYLHVLGATILLGTGAGIAFFMLLADRTSDPAVVAGLARIVVIADPVHRDGGYRPAHYRRLARSSGRLFPVGGVDRLVHRPLRRDRGLVASRGLDADAHA